MNVNGNARPCVFLEPLFTIPQTMYIGYMTLYMLALGMTKSQVGLVTSLGLAANIVFATLSAYITDKIGRKQACLWYDIIGWAIPLTIYALAQNIYYFIAGIVIASFGYVTMNSWQCLMLEDSNPSERIHIFNFLQIASIIGGFFSPIGGILINKFSLIPAMRIMFVFAILMMMTLFVVRHFQVKETETGIIKMQEMKGVKVGTVLKNYGKILKRIGSDHLLVIAILLRALNFIQLTVKNTFLAVLVTERLGFPTETMAIFQTLTAIVMLVVLVFITPVLSSITRRWPIAVGVFFHIGATVILLLAPAKQNMFLLILSALLIAIGSAIATPRIDSLAANTIKNEERTVANAVIAIILLLISSPFGYIGGLLSEIDTRLPFVLILFALLLILVLLIVAKKVERKYNAVE